MVFVTAATGTVGSQVVEELLKLGVPIRAGVHSRPLEIDGVESHKIDFNRPETMASALKGVSDLFLASYETWHEQNTVPVAQEAGVQRIVKLSAWRAADEAFIVGRWHRDVERAIEDSGMAWTFLRPNMFMQNTINVMGESIRKENSIYDSVEDARVSYIDTRDVGRVAAKVLTEQGHEGKAYDLSGPEAVTHEEIAGIFTKALGRKIRFVRISDDEYRQRWKANDVPDEEADAWVDINRYIRTGDCSPVTSNVEKITSDPPIPFEQFCRDYASVLSPEKDGVTE